MLCVVESRKTFGSRNWAPLNPREAAQVNLRRSAAFTPLKRGRELDNASPGILIEPKRNKFRAPFHRRAKRSWSGHTLALKSAESIFRP